MMSGPASSSGGVRNTRKAMTRVERLIAVARTDTTFERRGGDWVGKCLICNGPIAFDARTGTGATIEHIRARGRGGTEALENLAIVHAGCNAEKGRRWDPKRRRPAGDYDDFVARMIEKRARRWRPPASDGNDPPASPSRKRGRG
jgi:5-methylcytosine-specific restriction endonuclease McrA